MKTSNNDITPTRSEHLPHCEKGFQTIRSIVYWTQRTLFTGKGLALICLPILAVGCATTGSPLHQAAEGGQVDKVRALVEKGCNVNKPDKSRGTPLMVAVRNGREPAARYLIDHGADVNANVPSTPLFFAAQKQQAAMVTLLLEKGARVDAHDPDGDTALHGAANGNSAVAALLLKAGAQVNATNKAGWTPLNLAAKQARRLQPSATARLLLDAGAVTNIVPKNAAVTGKTIGVYASYLMERGRTNEAAAAYAMAKSYLERGVQDADKRRAAASRKSFWASVFEPMPQTPGSTYRQGAIERNLMTTMGTALFAGHSSSDYASQKSSAANEMDHLKACLAECAGNMKGVR